MKRFFKAFNYFLLMGPAWFLYRIKYEILKRTSYFDKRNISTIKKTKKLQAVNFYKFPIIGNEYLSASDDTNLAESAINGEIKTFSSEILNYSENGKINWHYNPVNRKRSPEDVSWNKIPDFADFGDIKIIWEASRFPQIYSLINAYSQTKNEKFAKAFINQLLDWCSANPYPLGCNYKCGQEISFRLFSWFNGLAYFSNFVKESEWEIIAKNIYTSLLRIEFNIEFAAKSVRNNHSISEAAGLLIGGLLLPDLPESKRFVKMGHEYLKKELSYQVFNDGSYIQHSFVYQRLALDTLSYVMHICSKLNYNLDNSIKQAHEKMIVFLNSFMQEGGLLPNYGANDGANLFPLNTEVLYRDFKESLNFACAVNFGKYLTSDNRKTSEFFGYSNLDLINIEKKQSFEDGGYFILRNKDIFVFTRCHTYNTRPSHSDSLHVDIWIKGENVFCDSGTYSYNGDVQIVKKLKGVEGHNTVLINKTDPMDQAGRFGWSNWIKAKLLKYSANVFDGLHYGYQRNFGITHRRKIELSSDEIIIKDFIDGVQEDLLFEQLWTTNCKILKLSENEYQVGPVITKTNADSKVIDSQISNHYNNFEAAEKLIFYKTDQNDVQFKTTILISGNK